MSGEEALAAEALRQQTILAHGLDGPESDPAFDRISEFAAELFDVPMAVVTVLTERRMLFRGGCGLHGGADREAAFCNVTVQQAEPLIISDARADPRFAANPLVTGEPFIRFYAGAPILIGGGVAVGALCLIDQQPRTLSDHGRAQLQRMAAMAGGLMEAQVGRLLSAEREAENRRRAQLLRTMVDNLDEGLAFFDEELKLAMANDRFFELHGLSEAFRRPGLPAAEMLAEAVRIGIFDGQQGGVTVDSLLENIAREPRRRIELNTRDGRVLDSLRTRLPDGRGFLLTVRDLTAERASTRLKDDFVSTVSHELRTPLTSIRGALALLGRAAEERLDERGRQMLAMAQQNAARLSSLIDDILDVERLETGSIAFVMLPLDLRDTLREAVEQNRPYAEALGVALAFDLPGAVLPVRGDPGRLLQVLTNLLSNAAKFSPRGGAVRVAAERTATGVRVRVEDDGAGVPPEFEPRLFQRFAQASVAKQAGRSGTGLGLAISAAIIARHGGEIGYERLASGGSSFWFNLPVDEGKGG